MKFSEFKNIRSSIWSIEDGHVCTPQTLCTNNAIEVKVLMDQESEKRVMIGNVMAIGQSTP